MAISRRQLRRLRASCLTLLAAPAAAQLSFEPAQLWNAGVPGFEVPPQVPTGFAGRLGAALATGDFDADGFQDLALGDPVADPDGLADAGAVYVLAGSGAGLQLPNIVVSQASAGSPNPAEVANRFGGVLAACDFDRDGADDLAVGLPAEHVGPLLYAGAVQVIYGKAGRGLESGVAQYFTEDDFGYPWVSAEGNSMGQALAAGDFNDDGACDLAIGVPFEGLLAGLVHVLYGSTEGLSTAGMQSLHQDSVEGRIEMLDRREAGDRFGRGLAAGDFNGDGIADLAIGVAGEDEMPNVPMGAVAVVRGSPGGLTLAGNQLFRANEPGMAAPALTGLFGLTLAVGDFDGNAHDDLAISAIAADVTTASGGVASYVGGVRILHGTPGGLTLADNEGWTAESPFVPEEAESSDHFGLGLAAGDFDGDGYADLGIGVPGESVGSVEEAGAALLLFGAPGGLKAGTLRYWTLGSKAIGGTVGSDERFGAALAAGDFNGDGLSDLVIGAPTDRVDDEARGSAAVLYHPAPGVPPILQ